MRPLYIFDLDGTLALNEHRAHLLPNWDAYFAACDKDQPNWPVIDTMHILQESGAEIRIWSGRSRAVRDQTMIWICRCLGTVWSHVDLQMRQVKDHRPDEVLKLEWLQQLDPHDRRRLVAVFDDRDKVVAMWRSNGVACFQVAPGDF